MEPNPFFYGNPVSADRFIGRHREQRKIISRLLNQGQSSAIIGDPRVGKTSLLNYLANETTRSNLYGDESAQWHFSQIDLTMLEAQCTPAQFWEHILIPVREHTEKASDSHLTKCYEDCSGKNFGNLALESLFSSLRKADRRLVLLLDELDDLLHHPALNTSEFFGGLRSLSSLSQGAFSIIFTSRKSLSELNAGTQDLNPTGSPFFNIFSEITIGPLSGNDTEELLSSAGDRFTDLDRQGIRTLAGNHPYLLHATAHALWDAYEEDTIDHPEDRQHYILKQIYRELNSFFLETWKVWKPEIRKTFTFVAVAHQAHLLKKEGFFNKAFLKGIAEWKPELDELQVRGWIRPNSDFQDGYCLNSQIMLTWLADELAKLGRDSQSFENWLQDKGIDGAFLSVNEKKIFSKTITDSVRALYQPTIPMFSAVLQEMTKMQ